MWILTKEGVAINTDSVAKFRQSGNEVIAYMVGLPQIITSTIVGETTVQFIMANIASGTKVLEVQ